MMMIMMNKMAPFWPYKKGPESRKDPVRRAKASFATNATGRCQDAAKRTAPQRKRLVKSRKRIESRQSPRKPSGCNEANVRKFANLKKLGQQTPRSCPRAGGNAVCGQDTRVITGVTSVGMRG